MFDLRSKNVENYDAAKGKTSHQKRKQSKQLLETAKTGVERTMLLQSGYANETDESVATIWINES
jgi:hypothetical protein